MWVVGRAGRQLPRQHAVPPGQPLVSHALPLPGRDRTRLFEHTSSHAWPQPWCRSFPELEKAGRQRKRRFLTLLTAADPLLDPITRGFFQMVRPGM